MKRQGYTVAEVMAALLILGLAFTALFQGTWAIRRSQAQTAQRMESGRAADAARSALVRFLSQPGAPAEALLGTAAGLSMRCGSVPCTLTVTVDNKGSRLVSELDGQRTERALQGVKRPAMRYLTSAGELDRWPAPAANQVRLVAVAIVDEGANASPVATVRLWSQQPQDCMFDSISAQCQRLLP